MARSRIYFTLSAVAFAGSTTEVLQSSVPNRNGVNGGGATSHALTSGRTLVITGISVSVRAGTAATHSTRITLRHNPSGAAIATSPVVLGIATSSPTALSSSTKQVEEVIPGGLEIKGGQIGITQSSFATTTTVSVVVYGYEY